MFDRKKSLIDRAVERLGAAEPVKREPLKRTMMSFKAFGLRASLMMLSDYDERLEKYGTPYPKIYIRSGQGHVSVPVESKLLYTFADFIHDMADAVKDVDVPMTMGDFEALKKALDKYRDSSVDIFTKHDSRSHLEPIAHPDNPRIMRLFDILDDDDPRLGGRSAPRAAGPARPPAAAFVHKGGRR